MCHVIILNCVIIAGARTCRNHETRQNILKDVMGTIHRIRNLSSPKSDSSADDEQKKNTDVSSDTAGDDDTSRVDGLHADPSVRV